jgi:DNA uptake protein ComE-like DNA-binding protein
MQLSGVGRRAAERIIAHRVANGPFASVGELSAVEGWHAERIRRIADSATT